MSPFPPDTRSYTEDEERTLALCLADVARAIARGDFRERRLDVELLKEVHRALFHRVRSHAGRLRGPGEGQEFLVFGPNRSVHRNEVAAKLDEAFRQADSSARQIIDESEAPDHDLRAITLAVCLHAEIIRIHPFEDGNGRSSRLILNWVLLRLRLKPTPIEVPKSEYRDCLNHYFRTRDLGPLVDLYLVLLADGLNK